MGLFLRKNHLLRYWGWLSLLHWIEAFKLSLLLTLPPKKLEPWFVLWSFFLLTLLCNSINLPYSHVRLVLLDKLQKRICRTVGLSLAASLEPLAHRRIVASLSFFYRYYFGRCSSELAQLVPLILEVGLLITLIDCMIFLSLFLDVTRILCP